MSVFRFVTIGTGLLGCTLVIARFSLDLIANPDIDLNSFILLNSRFDWSSPSSRVRAPCDKGWISTHLRCSNGTPDQLRSNLSRKPRSCRSDVQRSHPRSVSLCKHAAEISVTSFI
ncbi:hypothetical protein M404DRAFT_993436, partial [Pisolithus tinctorius Marx 270]